MMRGYTKGKSYLFSENRKLLSSFLRYPQVKVSIFRTSQMINYDKSGNISSISYYKFDDEKDLHFFWFDLYFIEIEP